MTLADQVRDFIARHYMDHGPHAHNWHRLADEIDRLEGTGPQTGRQHLPCPDCGEPYGTYHAADCARRSTITAPENETP